MALVTVAASSLLCFAVAEVVLRHLRPVRLETVGQQGTDNGQLYGWGNAPRALVRIPDPDSGQEFQDYLNARGWRDRDHAFANPSGAFRVLVLGDSNTFGMIVPLHALYTRVLERRLQEAGYDAEVISLGYGGWGTDQELEALRLEGKSYRPRVVILHYATNDNADNLVPPEQGLKPFFYTLAPNGTAARNDNPHFWQRGLAAQVKKRLRDVVPRSEILKHLYLLRQRLAAAGAAGSRHRYGSLVMTPPQLLQMKVAFGVSAEDLLGSFLRDRLGQDLDRDDLLSAIRRSPHASQEEGIVRLAEYRWFHDYWHPEQFQPRHPDPDQMFWRLLFALIHAMGGEARASGADFVILSDNDEGHYRWERYWFRIAPDADAREAYLAPSALLRAWCQGQGIHMVEPLGVVKRARNDPHPNVEGNRVIAESLYHFLTEKYGPELERHRRPGRRP